MRSRDCLFSTFTGHKWCTSLLLHLILPIKKRKSDKLALFFILRNDSAVPRPEEERRVVDNNGYCSNNQMAPLRWAHWCASLAVQAVACRLGNVDEAAFLRKCMLLALVAECSSVNEPLCFCFALPVQKYQWSKRWAQCAPVSFAQKCCQNNWQQFCCIFVSMFAVLVLYASRCYKCRHFCWPPLFS